MNLRDELEAAIRTVPDFPIEGIQFRDITPLLSDPHLMRKVTASLAEAITVHEPTCIAGPEARGFIFGPLLADKMGIPFIPIRKPGKLPHRTVSVDYALEYGTNTLEMHEDAMGAGDRAAIVDDLLATGGTVAAAADLITSTGARAVAACFVIELEGLNGRGRLPGISTHSLICLPA